MAPKGDFVGPILWQDRDHRDRWSRWAGKGSRLRRNIDARIDFDIYPHDGLGFVHPKGVDQKINYLQ